MRKVLKLKLLRRNNYIWYNYYWQMSFKYSTVFFGALIFKGYKLKAFNNFLRIKQGLKTSEKRDPFIIFLVSMMKISPDIAFLPIKLGGATYGVPMPISERQRIVFSVKWVLKLLKDKYKTLNINQVIDVMVSAIYDKGLAMDKKRSIYKQGSVNRHLLKFFK